jgi:large subunit ribosomal protein L18
MARSKTFTVGLKRKQERKTNYKKRLKYLKSGKTRIVIRPSTKNIVIQAINFKEDGDKVLITYKATELRKLGWKYNLGNLSSAYLTGLSFGVKNKDKIKEAIIDIGLRSIIKGDRTSAIIKGIVDSGMKVPHSDVIFPDENRINGTTIADYAKLLSSDKERYEKQFSKYLKEGLKPEDIQKDFEKIKETIISGKK